MASLTTIGGVQIFFDSKSIAAVVDHDASTGAAGTYVYGVGKTPVDISETVAGFFARLDIAGNFAQLTRPNGSPIWISGAAVSTVRPPLPGEYVAGVNAVVFTGPLTQGVTETVRATVDALHTHGANL